LNSGTGTDAFSPVCQNELTRTSCKMLEGSRPQLLDHIVFYIILNLTFSPTENAQYLPLLKMDTGSENPFCLPFYFASTASKPQP
jgi:hypothetical protein